MREIADFWRSLSRREKIVVAVKSAAGLAAMAFFIILTLIFF